VFVGGVDAGIEDWEKGWEGVGCGEEAEGFVETSVMAEGLVEFVCGFGDDA